MSASNKGHFVHGMRSTTNSVLKGAEINDELQNDE